MSENRDFDRAVDRWLDDGSDATPPGVIAAVLLAARSTPQERDVGISWRTGTLKFVGFAVATVAALAVGIATITALSSPSGVGSGTTASGDASVDLGIFAPVAGWIVYGDTEGIWGIDPAGPADPAATVQVTPEAGIPLGWSSDGTRLLIRRGGLLFVLDADGSETQLIEQPIEIRGATISPDGSRVVFAAGTGAAPGGGCCARFALYAVNADGGRAELLRDAQIGFVEEPTYSPDGARIAYVDGAGDNNHHVMMMNADGSDAHEIASRDCACHVYGLAWSPAGDQIALVLEGTLYTFAADGTTDLTWIAGGGTTCDSEDSCRAASRRAATAPYWSPDGLRLAYTTGCIDGPEAVNRSACMLVVSNANGSNVREFGFAGSGPWHPGTPATAPGG